MCADGRKVRLRKAVPADLSALEALESLCFPSDRQSSRRSMSNSLRSPTQSVWVAEAGNTAVGAMVLFVYPRRLRIYSIAVALGHRDLGAGKRLVRLAKALARRGRREAVTLEADVRNNVLIDWYCRQGFQQTEILEDYYGPGQPACRMEWACSRNRREAAL